jgi:hypothetical protein
MVLLALGEADSLEAVFGLSILTHPDDPEFVA